MEHDQQIEDSAAEFLSWHFTGRKPEGRLATWIDRSECCHCKAPVAESDAVCHVTYWWKCRTVAHKECEKRGARDEAQACREIDRNCNDCRFFAAARFEGVGSGIVRVGSCHRGLSIHYGGPNGATPIAESGTAEIRVFPGDPMLMECFELRV